ncbi:MAG: DNA repair exonuclease [Actinobacteria bacterium]|nr:DNA repair exonuclease [Actinomycetota bacterium]
MEKELRIIHFSDVHLGKSFKNIIKTDPEKRKLARQSLMFSFEKAFQKVLEMKPDLVAIAGDIFDRSEPMPKLEQEVYKILSDSANSLKECFFVILPGGHDRLSGISPYEREPLSGLNHNFKNVFVANKKENQVVRFSTQNLDEVCVYLSPHQTRATSNKLLKDLNIDPNADFNIAVVHGSVVEALPGFDEIFDQVSISDMEKLDYVALGHWHSYKLIKSKNRIVGAYSGSLSNIDFSEKPEDINSGLVFTVIKKDDFQINTTVTLLNDISFIRTEFISASDLKTVGEQLNRLEKELFFFINLHYEGSESLDEISNLAMSFNNVLEIRVTQDEKPFEVYEFPETDFRHFLIKAIEEIAESKGASKNSDEVKYAKHFAIKALDAEEPFELSQFDVE